MRIVLSLLSLTILAGLLLTSPARADGHAQGEAPKRFLLVGWVAETSGALKADQTGLNRPLHKGSAIVFKDTISVGPDGMATIMFKDGTRLLLEANSMMRVDQMSFGAGHDGATISLSEGTFRLEPGRIASQTKGRVIVQTPAAMVHAQGPVYINHRGGLSTIKLTGKGLAHVTSAQGETRLTTPDSEARASVDPLEAQKVSTL
ncbi:MAG: FecR domain-containing protein [Magnetovibrionaceae bacterium]